MKRYRITTSLTIYVKADNDADAREKLRESLDAVVDVVDGSVRENLVVHTEEIAAIKYPMPKGVEPMLGGSR